MSSTDGFLVGSYVSDYDDEYLNSEPSSTSEIDTKPKISLRGLKRSGKTSIAKVVFHKMSPNETLFLEATTKPAKEETSSFIQFLICDNPGGGITQKSGGNSVDGSEEKKTDEFNLQRFYENCGAVIYVIDSQDEYIEALRDLDKTLKVAYRYNPLIKFEIFIHKIDGLSDDQKIETQREISKRVHENLADSQIEKVRLSFHLTSIYDHSIFEAFSKVVQKLIPQLPTLENLLNVFILNSGIEKAFLFDVASKIYVATDSSPVDMQSYELCCDVIDISLDVSCIYGESDEHNAFDEQSQSLIKLSNNTTLYLRQVNQYLALVCIARSDSFDKKGLIDLNFVHFKEGVQKVFEISKKFKEPVRSGSQMGLEGPTDADAQSTD